ncbi:cytochrome c553 [Gluconacetobacter sacchari DSM 12717]|uniref:Cytochrome c n=2 Tax=Gluconacetobacter sacchari TaxID=92759 RepID=A0A7W4NJ33_9PROT|nr:c-type cytochrome [Gluconacetobacter sacchari]MBB2158682.1 cytochrome c [Gluconacetobacter sacchari]GBQ18990.1 cytochrome c553 [Gluconacetobacter sacchari DSM 12717]
MHQAAGSIIRPGWRRAGALALLGATLLAARPSRAADAPDPAAGRAIAESGVLTGHVGCSACHLMNGAGQPDVGIPRLAGFTAAYLEQQLGFFATDKRASIWMAPYARMLTPKQIQDVAAYYAGLPEPPSVESDPAGDALRARGKEVFQKGNMSKGVMPCGGCHGPAGQGMGTFAPHLAGQSAPYLLEQLRHWHQGRQRDPMGKMMATEAHAMTDSDMQAVASYLQSLPAPGAGGAK